MKTTLISLNGLEIFFIVTTVVSLVFNIIQFIDRRTRYKPLYNELIALFNDIKNKANHLSWLFTNAFVPQNPHKSVDTLRWEYAHLTQLVVNFLNGFQESVVSLLVTLDPRDPEGEKTFKASAFGLTPDERLVRDVIPKTLATVIQKLQEALQEGLTPEAITEWAKLQAKANQPAPEKTYAPTALDQSMKDLENLRAQLVQRTVSDDVKPHLE